MLSYDHQGGGGLTSLTSTSLRYGTRCLKKSTSVPNKYTLGPTARHGVIMLPCCSLWLLLATSALALKRREEEKTGRLNVALI